MNQKEFLTEHTYIDYSANNIQDCMKKLFAGVDQTEEKAHIAYHYVRDEIPHSFDCGASVITARASDVLRYQTGICHAKANLLAALLRAQGIPVGLCYQRLTLLDDDSKGYCLHCYNAVYLDNRWIKLDARGNTKGIKAEFSMDEPVLAFAPQMEYDEYFYDGIFSAPHPATMRMLEDSRTLQDIFENIPDCM